MSIPDISGAVRCPKTSEVRGSFHTYLIWISDQLSALGLNHWVVVVYSTSRSSSQPLCTPNALHTTAAVVPLWKEPTLEIAPETHSGMSCPVRAVNLNIIYLLIYYLQIYYIS